MAVVLSVGTVPGTLHSSDLSNLILYIWLVVSNSISSTNVTPLPSIVDTLLYVFTRLVHAAAKSETMHCV